MIKWPWKVQESAHQTALPWQEALSIPLLTCLTEQEQSKLVTPVSYTHLTLPTKLEV